MTDIIASHLAEEIYVSEGADVSLVVEEDGEAAHIDMPPGIVPPGATIVGVMVSEREETR